MPKKRVAYSYVRFSRPEQAKGHSQKRQNDLAEDWCGKHGFKLDTTVKMTDKGLSGFSGEHLLRGKLGAFIDLAKAGRIEQGSVLIVESLDRLSRLEVPTALRLLLEILDYGIEIVTLLEPEEWFKRETLSEIQLIVAIVILSRAYNESASKSQRLKKKWTEKRQLLTDEKKPLTGLTPSWIIKKGDSLHLHPEKSSIVRRIVRLYLDGTGIVAIARTFNTEHVPTLGRGKQKGKVWSKSTILKILRSRALIGEFQPHFGRKTQDQSKRIPAGDPIPDYFPTVVSEADFYRVQKILHSRKFPGRTGPASGVVSNLFTGLIFDARSGSTMNMVDKGVRSGGKQIVSSAAKYGIGEYISFNYDAFEEVILKLMKSITVEEIRPATTDSDLSRSLETLVGNHGRVEHKIKMIQDQIESEDDVVIAKLVPVISKLSRQLQELEEEIERTKAELHSAHPTPDDCTDLVELLQTANDDTNTNRRRFRSVIRDIIERIDVLLLKDGHWRQCFARVVFRNGRIRVVVANVHRKRLVNAGGYDGDFGIAQPKVQEHLQAKLGELKVRSVEKTAANLKDQLYAAAALRPGVIEFTDDTISHVANAYRPSGV